jgi:hypothetical protein
MDKDALIAQLVEALNKAVPFIGYDASVPDVDAAAMAALGAAQSAGFESRFGEYAVDNPKLGAVL